MRTEEKKELLLKGVINMCKVFLRKYPLLYRGHPRPTQYSLCAKYISFLYIEWLRFIFRFVQYCGQFKTWIQCHKSGDRNVVTFNVYSLHIFTDVEFFLFFKFNLFMLYSSHCDFHFTCCVLLCWQKWISPVWDE